MDDFEADRNCPQLVDDFQHLDQAYKKVREDGHPIVFINGKNITDYIFDELEIRSEEQLLKWLKMNY